MELTETRVDGVVVLSMNGKLDAMTAPAFMDWFQGQNAGEVDRFVLECGNLTYLSSAGLRAFLTIGKQIKTRQGALAFCELSGVVREVFQVSGFGTIFDSFPTLDAALAAVNSSDSGKAVCHGDVESQR